MPKATGKITHGFIDKDNQNKLITMEAGDDAAKSGLPRDVWPALIASGALADEKKADEAAQSPAA